MTTNACPLAARRNAVKSNDSIVAIDYTYEEIGGGGGGGEGGRTGMNRDMLADEHIYETIDGYVSDEDDAHELDDILQDTEDGKIDEQEKEAIYEFVEAKKKSKYLFDGTNMIRIRPRKTMAIKAAIGKAYVLHKRLQERRRARDEGRFDGYIADFIPKSGPNVPLLLYHCINEIEARECTVNGIYRVGGCPEQIKKLKKKFLKGRTPDLRKYHINVLTGTILSFLRDLKEPLIPPAMWEEFNFVGQIDCIDTRVAQLKELLIHIPKANRDTLGFLISHMQGVSLCPRSWMPLANFARLFGPILVGYSVPEREEDEKYMVIETMYGLLNIDPCFFTDSTEL